MKKKIAVKWQRQEIILVLILAALCIDIAMRLPISKCVAETFELDKCITATASEKPGGYVHVVTHQQ